MQEKNSQFANKIITDLKSALKIKTDRELCDLLKIKQNTLSTWKKRNSVDYGSVIALCELMDIDINEIFKNNPTTIHKISEINKIKDKGNTCDLGIPLIPIDAMAGAFNGDFKVLEYECERFVVPTFKGADFLISVKGSSMYPKYNSGDIVACKRLQLDTFFQWNKVYVLDTDHGALIKRVKKGKNENSILIVSDNPSYEPFELLRSKIYHIALVLGVIRLE